MKSLKIASFSLLVLTALLLMPRIAVSGNEVIGTYTFTRTHGPANQFSQAITIPASIIGPLTLSLVNGDASSIGSHGTEIPGAVSSGSVSIDGIEVVLPRELSVSAREIIKPVYLTPGTHILEVKIGGRPDSFVTLTFLDNGVAPPPFPPSN